MPDRSRRNTPCDRCRSRHVACHWSLHVGGGDICGRCYREGAVCSGPNAKSRSPCDSCARSSVRCDWSESDMICKRCQSRGSVCPMPPRGTKRGHSQISSEPLRHRVRQSVAAILDMVLDKETRQALAHEGRRRLDALQMPYRANASRSHSRTGSSPLTELSLFIHAFSGLKFCSYVRGDGLSSAGALRPIENVTIAEWLRSPSTKNSVQEKALITLYRRSLRLVRDLPSGRHLSIDDIIYMVSTVHLFSQLIALPAILEDKDIFRQLCACVVLTGVLWLREQPDVTVDQARTLVRGLLELSGVEASLSLELGVKSMIKTEILSTILSKPFSPDEVVSQLELQSTTSESNDGYPAIDLNRLRNILMPHIMDNVYWLLREAAALGPEVRYSDRYVRSFRTQMDSLYGWFTSLATAITSATPYEDAPVHSKKTFPLLRMLFRLELTAIRIDVLFVIAASSYHPLLRPGPDVEGQLRLVEALKKLARGVRLLVPPTSQLSDTYHIVDLVGQICLLLTSTLADHGDAIPSSDVDSLMDILTTSTFWDCHAVKGIEAVKNGRKYQDPVTM